MIWGSKFGNKTTPPVSISHCFSCRVWDLMILSLEVYCWCMARTNIDIDDEACAIVMRRYQLVTKRDAINFALRTLAAEPLGLDEARKLRGSGWIGELNEMRAHRTS